MWKREIGESGTRHLQGLICFPRRQRFSQVRAYFSDLGGTFSTAHIETMRGTLKQAEAYVQKEATRDPSNPEVVVGGDRPSSQGARTEMEEIVRGLKAGEKESGLLDLDPENYIRFSTGIKRAVQIRDKALKRTWKTQVFWLYGPTGTGKSKFCFDVTNYCAYVKNPSHNWWDMYEGDENIIIDDYRTNMCTFSELLRLFDRYPMQLQVKGSSTNMLAKRIFVTTPKNPYDTWCTRSDEDLQQLIRRITAVVKFEVGKEPWNETEGKVFNSGILKIPENESGDEQADSQAGDSDCESQINPDDSPVTKRRKSSPPALLPTFVVN